MRESRQDVLNAPMKVAYDKLHSLLHRAPWDRVMIGLQQGPNVDFRIVEALHAKVKPPVLGRWWRW